MGLFSLLARFVRPSVQNRTRFAAATMAPRRLERRRVLDGAAAGLVLEAIPDTQPYVQTSDNLSAQLAAAEQQQQVVAASNLQATIELRDAEIFENGFVLAVIRIQDSPAMAHQITIDWGDGSPLQIINVGAQQRDVLAVHQYLDDANVPPGTPADFFDIKATVTNPLGHAVEATTQVLVKNVAPKIDSLTITSPIDENGTAVLSGTYSDVGSLDTHTLDIDWDGDGTYDQSVAVSGGTFSVERQFLDDPAGNDDLLTVNVRLRDDDSGEALASRQLKVNNVPPTVVLVKPADITENSSAVLQGTITDPGTLDTFTLVINWGDPASPNNVQSFTLGSTALTEGADGINWDPVTRTFSLSHQYLDDNPPGTPFDDYTVSVEATDKDGGMGSKETSVRVHNDRPTVVLVKPTDIVENNFAVLEGTIADVGSQDTFTLVINWGDPTSPNNVQTFNLGTTVLTAAVDGINWDPATRKFSVGHQYLDDNPPGTAFDDYGISVQVTDDDQGTYTTETTVTVNNVEPTIVLVKPADINENEFALLEGTITDVGTQDTFELVIDWGDPLSPNNSQTFTLGNMALTEAVDGINWDPATRKFSLSHQYLDDNPSGTSSDEYTIRVTVTDDDTGEDTQETKVTVNNVGLTLNLDEIATIEENGSAALTGTINDVGTQDTFVLEINWGDPISPNNVQTFALGSAALTEAADGIDWDPTTRTFTVRRQYLDDDPTGTPSDDYTITVKVTGDDLSSDTQDVKVTVKNALPTVAFDLVTPIDENGTAILQGYISDVGSRDTFTITIDWKDPLSPNNIQTFSLGTTALTEAADGINWDPTTRTFSLSHQYLDDNPPGTNGDTYEVAVQVVDDDTGVGNGTADILVRNVAPVVQVDPVVGINEGGIAVLTGRFSDVGTLDTHTLIVNWGDPLSPFNIQTYALGSIPLTQAADGIDWDPTTGTFTVRRQYLDNDNDNIFTIVATVIDDDMGATPAPVNIFVRNVNPTLQPLVATDVTAQGIATVTITFSDPGTEAHTIHIDWGDNKPDTIVVGPALTPTTYTYTHKYDGPPDPLHPAADITIRVVIRDDDFGIPNIVDDGESNVETITISNPGIGTTPFRIDTTPQVPLLTFPVRAEAPLLLNASSNNLATQQNVDMGATSGEIQAASERYLELYVIDAEGNKEPITALSTDVLRDLPRLFRSLPDNHYALYIVNMETEVRRLVIEVYVRNGKVIDPSDDSEGTRDRPPTDEQGTSSPTETPSQQAPTAADQEAMAVPPVLDRKETEFAVTDAPWRRASRWSTLAIGLAATAASQSWARRVDQALAQATAQQWRKLQSHNPPKPKN